MRSLRSTLVLVVVLAGLVGYIYYLNGRDTTSTDAKEKAFASVKEEDVEDIRIKSADGETTHVQKADGAWTIVEPEAAAVTSVLTKSRRDGSSDMSRQCSQRARR